jgi:hypothetical protein
MRQGLARNRTQDCKGLMLVEGFEPAILGSPFFNEWADTLRHLPNNLAPGVSPH